MKKIMFLLPVMFPQFVFAYACNKNIWVTWSDHLPVEFLLKLIFNLCWVFVPLLYYFYLTAVLFREKSKTKEQLKYWLLPGIIAVPAAIVGISIHLLSFKFHLFFLQESLLVYFLILGYFVLFPLYILLAAWHINKVTEKKYLYLQKWCWYAALLLFLVLVWWLLGHLQPGC